ncbi:MAG TPA: sigma-70 family RNA polymerase sigma factor [Pirellulaceae bacterium]|nr:sigma-70 family RNA polymerase sigma factor [Pirellulaceae bacterium]HMO93502.1 sigma-70 family RNA polymerase sigma factor [Pirellulaceae bacterium]HMP70407.1 sigma-70 family RNA polymerase sigma factor [Pirellulaceae bacterium]
MDTANTESVEIDWPAQLDRHRVWLRKVVHCRLANEAAVEDCLQEIALAVIRQAKKPVDIEKVPAWLYRLAIRQAINTHRRNGRQKMLMEAFSSHKETADQQPCNADPLDWLINVEQQEMIAQAVSSLRPADREILVLKYSERWTYQQLSEYLGANVNTVEYRLIRAKKRLRAALNRLSLSETSV